MKTFVLESDKNITAFPSRKAAIASGNPMFSNIQEMANVFRLARISPLEVWNALPGVTPVKKFTDRATGMARIWKQLERLELSPDLPDAAAMAEGRETVAPHTPRAGSKQEQVLQLLKRPNGASTEAIMGTTGWQPHTVRGFIAGTLKKKLGLNIESFTDEAGDRTYRVANAV
jgi:hypothetical protein